MQEYIFNKFLSGKSIRVIRLCLLLLITGLLTSCNKEEVATKEYPRLNTLEVTGINESGAVFNAEAISGDLTQIKKYGFVWSFYKDPIFAYSDTAIASVQIENGIYSEQIFNSLLKDQTYYVRSFAVTDKQIIYGTTRSFKSLGCKAPVIANFYPRQVQNETLDTITIIGDNFSSLRENNAVYLDGQKVNVIESERTKLKFTIPPNNLTGKVKIRVIVAMRETESSDFLEL